MTQEHARILIGEKLRLIQQLLQECEVISAENHVSFVVMHPNMNRFSDIVIPSPFPQDHNWNETGYSEDESEVNCPWISSSESC